jgi:hypothetical protein
MRRLLTGYAVSFNRRHKRSGQLFQNRYKSIVCQEDAYLKELVRYIHLNPIRSGIVSGIEQLDPYPYCGHSTLIGKVIRPWQDAAYVLGAFGTKVVNAKNAYLDFMEEGIAKGRREDLIGGGLIRSIGGWAEVKKMKRHEHVMSDERILGDSTFVENLLSQANESYERCYEMKKRGVDTDQIVKRVAKICDMDPRKILSKGKQPQKVKARSLFCYWAVKVLGLSKRELARRLEMSPPAIGYCVERGEAIADDNDYRLIE